MDHSNGPSCAKARRLVARNLLIPATPKAIPILRHRQGYDWALSGPHFGAFPLAFCATKNLRAGEGGSETNRGRSVLSSAAQALAAGFVGSAARWRTKFT